MTSRWRAGGLASTGPWVGALALGLVLASCGQRPAVVPQVSAPAAPDGFHLITYSAARVRLDMPRSWTTTPQSPPLVTVLSSGGAVISLWHYPGAFGASGSHLRHAYRRLVAAALRSQPKLHVLSAGLLTVDGDPAVELDATEPIGAVQERVDSFHVFTPGAEVVLEEYAPPSVFDPVDRLVFEPVWRSLVVLGR